MHFIYIAHTCLQICFHETFSKIHLVPFLPYFDRYETESTCCVLIGGLWIDEGGGGGGAASASSYVPGSLSSEELSCV